MNSRSAGRISAGRVSAGRVSAGRRSARNYGGGGAAAGSAVGYYDYDNSTHPGKITITQPARTNVWEFENEWNHSVTDCCNDTKICFCAFCCPCCFLCELFSRTGECLCTPVFYPGALLALRVKLRTGFRIKGTMMDDCLISTFCGPCSAIQMHNELIAQGL